MKKNHSHNLLISGPAGSGKTYRLRECAQQFLEQSQKSKLGLFLLADASQESVLNLSVLNLKNYRITTLGKVAEDILRQNAQLLNIESDFTVLDQAKVLSKIEFLLNHDAKKALEFYQFLADFRRKPSIEIHSDYLLLLKQYREIKKSQNCLDEDDLIFWATSFLKREEKLKKSWQDQFSVICLDALENLDFSQISFLRELVSAEHRLMISYDEQKISSKNILAKSKLSYLDKLFPALKKVELTQQFRINPFLESCDSSTIHLFKAKSFRQEQEYLLQNLSDLVSELAETKKIAVFSRLRSDLLEISKPFENKQCQFLSFEEIESLEFDIVFIINCNADQLPLQKDTELTHAEFQKERELFYHAATRARKKLYISWTNQMSSFVNSILLHQEKSKTKKVIQNESQNEAQIPLL